MWTIVGQARALSLLENSLKRGRVAHAYLLAGPAHVGKMTLAKDLAMALNCEGETPPCGECRSCKRIQAGSHSDVQVIALGKGADGKPQTEIGVEEIRQVQHSANLPPFEGRCKVFIIDGAETLSTEAANRLLKTLEEPEDHVVFILLTAREDLVLPTVISRCQRMDLIPAPASQIESALVDRWKVPPERASLLSHLSRGRLGWAVASIEEGSLDQYNEIMDELTAVTDEGLDARFEYAAKLATEFSQSRERVQEKLGLWLDWWHDVLLVKSGLREAVVNIDRLAALEKSANALTIEQVMASFESITQAGEQLKRNANARLALEVMMLNLPEPGNAAPKAAGGR
jgi:DNA polymerase III subunit delta'